MVPQPQKIMKKSDLNNRVFVLVLFFFSDSFYVAVFHFLVMFCEGGGGFRGKFYIKMCVFAYMIVFFRLLHAKPCRLIWK